MYIIDTNLFRQDLFGLFSFFCINCILILINVKSDVEELISRTKSRIDRFEIDYISRSVCEHHYKVVSAALKDANMSPEEIDVIFSLVSRLKFALSDGSYQKEIK